MVCDLDRRQRGRMKPYCEIAVAGAGLIGRRHAEIIRTAARDVRLAAIVDPADEARDYADSINTRWYASLAEMFSASKPDGVILATPNQVHVENGLECVAAGCPMLVEKPIAVSSEKAQYLVDAARATDIPILVGHHRRHNPIIQKARSIIDEGYLGDITALHVTSWFLKPDDYYSPEWRRRDGSGPLMINAIHDVDLLRHLCGDIVRVHAISSNSRRGFDVEDTIAAFLMFQSGALGAFSLSDTVASPWSWETTSGENTEFTTTSENCYLIGGTKGSLSIPNLRVWRHEDGGHWKKPIHATPFPVQNVDPLVAQIMHFVDVIRGHETPLVSGEEGIRSLKVVEALRESALAGVAIDLVEDAY